jgi:ABC-type glycerol-3-phosphate transport system substrate-binding protein
MGAIEAPDGSLPAISNGFRIETIIGMANVAGDIKSWTFAEMLSLVEQTENSDITFILGEWMTAERFLDIALEFSGNDFINWPEKTSNLDSVEFIQLLEISSRLPNVMAPWDYNNLTSPITRMLNGEQLLDIIDLNNIHNYQMHTAMLGDDIVALGLPSHSGGSHLIHIPSGFAINTNSTQKDVAWSFIRQFLLPDVSQDELIGGFPLRLDLFEEMIIEAKTPLFEVDEDGKEVETPKIGMGQADFMVWIYALTETEEHGLRAIVENAHILGSSNETVMNIVREETTTYFAGGRSAADTARVLQNRIQIFLYEIE